MKILVFDIETTGLDWKAKDAKMHVMCGLEGVQELEVFDPYEAVNILNNYDLIVGHYIQFFDIPYLEYITNKKITTQVFDTKIIGGLLFPGRKSYSLKDWGHDLGLEKKTEFEYTDFSRCTTEMIEQCHRDVQITKKLYDYLTKQAIPQEAYNIETKIATIIQKQIEYGVGFNEKKAVLLYSELYSEYIKGKKELQEIFPPKTINIQLKTKVKEKIIEFNPSSNDHIAERLIEKYNWRPQKTTPTGKPSVDIETLSNLPYPECKILLKLSTIEKIMGYISDGTDSWLKHNKNGNIHGRVSTTGVPTGRMSHFSPNLAQVPNSTNEYGLKCRELFIPVTAGNVMIGCDASGLELRCLAHYLFPYDNGEMTKAILKGDIHQYNADILGCDRAIAKHFIYAFIYGAQPTKLSQILRCSINNAKDLKFKFENSIPGFNKFYRDLTNASKRGYLIGIDGRNVFTPLEFNKWKETYEPTYKRLNYLLQSAGAILMKKALCIANEKNPDLKFMLNIHDELQVDSSPQEAYNTGKILVDSIRESGEYFNLKCPLDAEFKVGKTWAETH